MQRPVVKVKFLFKIIEYYFNRFQDLKLIIRISNQADYIAVKIQEELYLIIQEIKYLEMQRLLELQIEPSVLQMVQTEQRLTYQTLIMLPLWVSSESSRVKEVAYQV